MKIFVYDTETTWFINKKDPDLAKQPKIVQFAWISWELVDWKFTEIEKVNIIIDPEVPIPFQASQVHHIYDIDVKWKDNFPKQYEWILKYINEADITIWHNIEYDEDVVKIELKRLDLEYKYKPKQTFCTMKTTVDFCKLQWWGKRFKYPKLWELHKKLFWEYFIWAHDAMTDVEATLRCFIEIVNKKIVEIKLKKENTMSLF